MDLAQNSRSTLEPVVYPFSALVGQEPMKRALILAAIHPGLGGVLIRGSKGAAKSTAVRALASLLPEIEVVAGDPFRRSPEDDVAGWPLPEGAVFERKAATLVNLPVGASDDRVVGSLNFERALTTGQRAFEPGLLAAAHRGLLYIDEVNLLGDHLVDLLLDVAAMGVNHVEREGLTFRHPSRFVLVGTMNPEEGDLRPQLLDRFGLVVEVEPMNQPAARVEVVRRRLAFEADPLGFRKAWAEAELRERERIARARAILSQVTVPGPVLEALCERCAREGADGLRADLTIYKAASALAAYEGRTSVTPDDVEAVAEFALAHRRTTSGPQPSPPSPSPSSPPDRDRGEPDRSPSSSSERLYAGTSPGNAPKASSEPQSQPESEDDSAPQVVAPSSPNAMPSWKPRSEPIREPRSGGRRGRFHANDRQGVFVRAVVPARKPRDPALVATLRAAAPWQPSRGRAPGGLLLVRSSDVRDKLRVRPARHLILFVVDASRSMGARRRMAETKGAVLALLVDAYQKRDRVGLVTFGGTSAQLVLPPTRSVRVAAKLLRDLPVGGLTPLAHGLALATRVIAAARRREPGMTPLIVLLTDGRGNVPLAVNSAPEIDALQQARILSQSGIAGLVIDTETGPVRLGRAGMLAGAWGADLKPLDTLAGRRLPDAVRRALLAG